MRMERTVREIAGDYAVLENETGGTTEVALALLPDGIAEGTVLIFENFECHDPSYRHVEIPRGRSGKP